MRKGLTYTTLGIISVLVAIFILWYLSERDGSPFDRNGHG